MSISAHTDSSSLVDVVESQAATLPTVEVSDEIAKPPEFDEADDLDVVPEPIPEPDNGMWGRPVTVSKKEKKKSKKSSGKSASAYTTSSPRAEQDPTAEPW
jgi:hypothetical protein